MNTNRLIQLNSLYSKRGSITKNGPVERNVWNQQDQIDDDEHSLLNGLMMMGTCPTTKRVAPPLPSLVRISTWLFRAKKRSLDHHHQLNYCSHRDFRYRPA
jgi:hypothetical protein